MINLVRTTLTLIIIISNDTLSLGRIMNDSTNHCMNIYNLISIKNDTDSLCVANIHLCVP